MTIDHVADAVLGRSNAIRMANMLRRRDADIFGWEKDALQVRARWSRDRSQIE